MGSGLWRTIFQKLSTGLEEIPAPDDLSDHFDQSYQTEFSRAGWSLFITLHLSDYLKEGLGEEAAERQELSRYPTSHRRVYWAGEKANTRLYYNFVLRDRNFQEPLGKPEKKRAALAHFDTIFSLDKIMVQLTIQAVLVSRRIIYSWASCWTRGVNIHQTMTNHTKWAVIIRRWCINGVLW